MKFSAILTCAQVPGADQSAVLRRSERYAKTAEAWGYQGVWLLEHHFTPYGLCPSPLTLGAYLLGRTTTLRVGSAVCVLPLYHPVRFAEDVALIDQMSGGRLDVGIGRGGGERDFEVFGGDPGKNHEVLAEWLDVAEAAWSGERLDHHGKHIDLPPVVVNPQPLGGRPPLYFACQSPSSVTAAAGRNIPMMLSYWLERESLVSQVELWDEVAEANGHDPDAVEHVAACIAFPADTHDEAIGAVRPHLSWWRREAQDVFFELEKLRGMGNYDHQVRLWEREIVRGTTDTKGNLQGGASVDRLLDLNPVGTVSECVDKLGQLAEDTGVEHFLCGFEGPEEEERVVEAMQRFAEEVVPQLTGSQVESAA